MGIETELLGKRGIEVLAAKADAHPHFVPSVDAVIAAAAHAILAARTVGLIKLEDDQMTQKDLAARLTCVVDIFALKLAESI